MNYLANLIRAEAHYNIFRYEISLVMTRDSYAAVMGPKWGWPGLDYEVDET